MTNRSIPAPPPLPPKTATGRLISVARNSIPAPPTPPAPGGKKLPVKRTWTIVSYTKNQLEFHEVIDRLMSIMSATASTAPQISRGRARDVRQLTVHDFSKYLRPTSPRWLFKEPIDPTDTLQKLEVLQNQFTKYCNTKVPDKYVPYCLELREYVKAAISLIKKMSKK